MENIGLFLVGMKGFQFLSSNKVDNSKIKFVSTYRDPKVTDVSYENILEYCKKNKIEIRNKESIDYDSIDKIFVIGWQYLIKNYLDKFVVFHDSWLPQLKGWNPTVTALIEGYPYVASTAFQPTEKMDEGPIYHQIKTKIKYPIKIKDAYDLVIDQYIEIFKSICENETKPILKEDQIESYSIWRDSDDYYIDWNWPVQKIKRFVDAVGYPFDGAKIKIGSEIITVNDVEIVSNPMIINRTNGKIFRIDNNCPIIIANGGLIKITRATVNGESYKFTKLKIRL